MSQPDFTVEYLDPKTLGENPFQFRRHPDSQKSALSASVKEFGWVDGPLLNKRTGHLIDGHLRRDEAIAQGRATIPVKVVDLSEADERRLLRLFDPITALATEDSEALDRLIAEIGDPDLERLLGELESGGGLLEGADPDAIPDNAPTRCKAGDLWRLGEHRLLCGDSTVSTDVERLMGEAKAGVLLTDPPYAVDYVEKARDMNARGYGHSRSTLAAAIEGDGIEEGQEAGLWRDAFLTAYAEALEENAAVYIWHAQGRAMLILYNLLAELGFLHHQTLIWVKNNFVIGRCDYQWKHEPCFYGWMQGNRPPFYGQKNQTTVWDVARDTNSPLHPTQKPVAIFEPALTNHLKAGEIAYDPFAGSGTTLIACEQTGRVARCMEIEPRYCNVVLARWEQATGKTAELIS